MRNSFSTLIATWFYSGLFPKAPGTAGSLAALPVVIILHYTDLFWLLPVLTFILLLVGVWASRRYMTATGKDGDPKEIVVDEVVGQWIVFAAMPILYSGPPIYMFWPILIAGFIAFRFFDVIKPWPISLIDRHMKGPWGVMLDDVAAGFAAIFSLALLVIYFPPT